MTGPLSPAEHAGAVAWLKANWSTAERPLIPMIRKRFDAGPIEAVQILREASPHSREVTTMNEGRRLSDVVEVVWHRQRYLRVGSEPYTRKNGTQTTLAIWRSQCSFCGAEFECTTPDEGQVFKGALHCPAHRRRADRVPPVAPGREFAPIEVYENDGARK